MEKPTPEQALAEGRLVLQIAEEPLEATTPSDMSSKAVKDRLIVVRATLPLTRTNLLAMAAAIWMAV